MMKALLVATMLVLPCVANAQMPVQAEPSPEMKKLVTAMAGEWRGTSWAMTPRGRVNISSWEKVEPKLGGLTLFVEGRHTSIEKADSGKVVHHAAAMVFFDKNIKKLRIIPVTMDGNTVDTWMTESPIGFDWGFDLPGGFGKVKYNVDLSRPGEWVEKGYFSRDGTTWMPSIELNLKRVSN